MGSFLWLICLSFLLTLIGNPTLVDSTSDKKLTNGPPINVTKQLSFPDFNLFKNPRIFHDVKLLGSAKFSESKAALQFPDESQTFDLRHQAGRAIYSSPIRLFDPLTVTPASFKTTFSFRFHNHSNSGSSSGSGLTFIIVPDEFTVGRPGPWLAMLNDACDEDYKAVAIEFDTRQNPEFGDPNDNHVGINLGTIVSTKTINASEVGVYLNDGSVHRAWINYDGSRRWMDIRLGPENNNYPSKSIFSGLLDLSPFLKEYMFVGFSASTGNMTQIHNVFSWNFTSTSQAFLRIPSTEKKQRPRPPNKPRHFSSSEISSATRNFSELEILGSDSKGVYYRGKLQNGCQVAVKRFSLEFLNSQGIDQRRLLKEIVAISRVRHPNLVPIQGWCPDNREAMVVYDFFPNGSLDKWLFGVGVLPWTRRFKVVKDVAEGLNFLHSKQLAHKNLKTTSVFLDISFRAVLGDFGFVMGGTESKRFESAISQSVDVFEFGVFVLEVVSGRNRRLESKTEKDLLDFAWRLHETDEKVKLIDKKMGLAMNIEQAIKVVEIGLLCTLNETRGRPCMEQVVEFLNMDRLVPELPPSRPVALFPYSSATGLCTGVTCAAFK